MNNDKNISEHQLNAFVDNELDAQEREMIFSEANSSSEIEQELCEYRKIKELVRHAYSEVPEPYSSPEHKSTTKRAGYKRFLTAAMLMVVGSLVGAVLNQGFNSQKINASQIVQSDLLAPNAYVQDINRIVLHLDSNDIELMDAALTRAEKLVNSSANENPVLVEVIANDKGLDLLRSDISPFADRISELSKQNVAFMACARGIQNLRNDNIEVNLLPGTNFHYTALDRVVDRLKGGWSYEKI